MKLLKLYSNLPTFRTIDFKDGVNFIIGKRHNPVSSKSNDTYNGVGKSLTVELIHFCLGSNRIKCFNELGNYYCGLDISIDGKVHSIHRNFNGEQLIFLDGGINPVSNSDIRSMLSKACSENNLPDNISFRSIISRFIRRGQAAYSKYDEPIKGEQRHISLANTIFLFGMDVEHINNKIKNKEKYIDLSTTKKRLKSDEILVDYFNGKGNIEFRIRDLEDQKLRLENRIKDFNIVDNYSEVKKDADSLAVECNRISNRITYLSYLIEKSSNIETANVSAYDVENLYSEMNIALPELVVKKVYEINNFHNELMTHRKKAYESQKKKYIEETDKLERDLSNKRKVLDNKLAILKSSGALEEYNAMCQELANLSNDIKKMEDYKILMTKYENEIEDSKLHKATITQDNRNYLGSVGDKTNHVMEKFRAYAKRFYPDKPSGISIELNSKDNKISYNIIADIEGDSSDGINEVKMFCFDMTLLKLHNHKVSFIFHDSRLLANMDPRQRITWFDIIRDEFPDSYDDQYIVSLNEDYLLSMYEMDKDVAHLEAMKKFVSAHTRIELTDSDPSNKLLGIQVNIKYDK